MPNPVVIVGAGPAGLAAAGALKQKSVQSTLLEAGDAVGTSWRHHYERLRLHTVRGLSGLPGLPIPAEMGKWVARADLVAYLEEYAKHFQLEIRFGTHVEKITRESAGGYCVQVAKGELAADTIVLATGYNRRPVLPDWPGRDSFEGDLLHSSRYRKAEPYRGRRVLVVGSGNSGAEIAVDLVEGGAAEVLISIRTPPNIQRREFLGIPTQVVGMLGAKLPVPVADRISLVLQRIGIGDLRPYGLDPPTRGAMSRIYEDAQIPLIDMGFLDALRARKLTVVPAVEGFAGKEVILAGERRVRPDAVIAATGFERALEPIVGELGLLKPDGVPVVSGGETSPKAPRLHFIGYVNSPGGLLRQIRLDAAAIAEAVAASAETAA
jgi:cation diffusion facilitator CzcD-associated flavoprotein CzcO